MQLSGQEVSSFYIFSKFLSKNILYIDLIKIVEMNLLNDEVYLNI